MSVNPLKNCIPFSIDSEFIDELLEVANDPTHDFHDEIENHRPVDPSGGQWRTSGIPAVTLAGNEPITPVSPEILMMAVQFNERILPGKVRDEHLAEAIAQIEEREGRKPGRKEYAQLREQVEFDLLPKAFIRRSWVYVTFLGAQQLMLVHTSSAKRSDDVIATMAGLFSDFPVEFKPCLLRPKTPIETLTRIARDGYQDGVEFEPTDSAVLRGGNKEVVRLKDMDIGSADVEALLDQDYVVTELGLRMFDDDTGDESIRFVLNDKFVFKRIEAHDVKLVGNTDPDVALAEFQSYALMLNTYVGKAVNGMLAEMGGHVAMPDEEETPQPIDDEDEL